MTKPVAEVARELFKAMQWHGFSCCYCPEHIADPYGVKEESIDRITQALLAYGKEQRGAGLDEAVAACEDVAAYFHKHEGPSYACAAIKCMSKVSALKEHT